MDTPPDIGRPVLFRKGRGAATNTRSRFEAWTRERAEDIEPPELGASHDGDDALPLVKTQVAETRATRIISRNTSPDIPFDQSINPYMGCEHGCSYCYARPTHAYIGLSPGLDFETKLFAKTNAVELLEKELSSASYQPSLIALGANTDPYQPIERKYQITRGIVETLVRRRVPFSVRILRVLWTSNCRRRMKKMARADPAIHRIPRG